jgi:uncharacterized membrane protein YkoI
MTNQANLGLRDYGRINKKALTTRVVAMIALITIMYTLAPIGGRNVDAQMMGNHGEDWAANMTPGQHQQHEQETMNNGTINLEKLIFQAINSRINISLTQALTIAEKSVGNDAFAVAAFGSEEGGYFAYRIILATPAMKFYYVKVDPGNGQILATQETSKNQLEKMHLEHSSEVVHGGGGSAGFPLLIPH